jgi:hypothetical protein
MKQRLKKLSGANKITYFHPHYVLPTKFQAITIYKNTEMRTLAATYSDTSITVPESRETCCSFLKIFCLALVHTSFCYYGPSQMNWVLQGSK